MFVHQIRVARDLALSGKRVEITERWGKAQTDLDEALLTRTVFIRYYTEIKGAEQWKIEALGGPVVDRELKGDDTFLHLRFEEGCLRDDNGCWIREDGNFVLWKPTSTDQNGAQEQSELPEEHRSVQEIFKRFEASRSPGAGVAFSPATEFFLQNGILRLNQPFQLTNGKCSASVKATHSGGGFIVIHGSIPSECGEAFTVVPETKQKFNLAELYSLRAGLGTPLLAEKQNEKKDPEELSEKEKRRQEIRERIKRGEEVSQEELLEVLEN